MKRLHQMLDQIHTMKPTGELDDILGIDSLVVKRVITNGDFILIRTIAKHEVAICPKCGKPTNIVHQKKVRLIRDLPPLWQEYFYRNHL